MCECGCGELVASKALRVQDTILVIEEYPGCRYCHTGMAVVLHFFDSEDHAREFIDDMPIEPITADEYGANNGRGEMIPMVGKEELKKAAAVIHSRIDVRLSDYDSLADVIDDIGLDLLQEALRQRKREAQ